MELAKAEARQEDVETYLNRLAVYRNGKPFRENLSGSDVPVARNVLAQEDQ